jgi:hypothetical protein
MPQSPPITIPASGGSFQYNVGVTNCGTVPCSFDAWIMVQLPDLSWYGPVLDPVNLTLPASTSIDRDRTQNVSAGAPSGSYIYEGRIGVYPDEIWESDSFTFEKLETSDGIPDSNWNNTGESFDLWFAETNAKTPAEFQLLGVHPNPFNLSTTISFSLPEDAFVKLQIFDITGRRVGVGLAPTRQYPPGNHHVTFDASGLPSGIYLARLVAGDFTDVQKMVLLK